MGGEKLYCIAAFCSMWGSPPRGRGKDSGTVHGCGQLRIIPAWAGKRRCTAACNGLCWDHPRVGGEKSEPNPMEQLQVGSPPHGRGKVIKNILEKLDQRITPAWAGKRATPRKNGHPGGDHPRVGGEKHCFCTASGTGTGSPPRGRGKVRRSRSPCWSAGITPAWAGKSSCYVHFTLPKWDHPRVGGEK